LMRFRHRKENPAVHAAAAHKRRARKRQALPAWYGELDEFVWGEAAHLAKLQPPRASHGNPTT
jgi:hypothetical protein